MNYEQVRRKNECLLSVIIPIYNADNYIENGLQTILNQSYKNIEVICVNDGSTDHSLEILEKYEAIDKRLRIITQENKGVSSARNLGLQLARGEYIYFFDADDELDLNTFEDIFDIFNNNPKIDCISFGYRVLENNRFISYSSPNYSHKIYSSKDFLRHLLGKEIDQSICSFIIRTKYIKELLFNEELITGEDLDFQFRVLLENDFVVYYDAMEYFTYYRREESTTKSVFRLANVKTLQSLADLRDKMLAQGLDIFLDYERIRFFYKIKTMACQGYIDVEYEAIRQEFRKHDYILNNMPLKASKRSFILYILAKVYQLDFAVLLYLFKSIDTIKLRF